MPIQTHLALAVDLSAKTILHKVPVNSLEASPLEFAVIDISFVTISPVFHYFLNSSVKLLRKPRFMFSPGSWSVYPLESNSGHGSIIVESPTEARLLIGKFLVSSSSPSNFLRRSQFFRSSPCLGLSNLAVDLIVFSRRLTIYRKDTIYPSRISRLADSQWPRLDSLFPSRIRDLKLFDGQASINPVR